MRILQVLDQAFRTTVEEQDETILWLIQSMLKKSLVDPENEMDVLFSGNAVYYPYQKLRQPPLTIAGWQQSQPAEIHRDIENLKRSGVSVFVVYEDLWDRGLELLPVPVGIDVINRKELPDIYTRADQVWHW